MPRGNGGLDAAMRAISNLSQPISAAATSTATAAIIKQAFQQRHLAAILPPRARKKPRPGFAAERGVRFPRAGRNRLLRIVLAY
jgi:hypothetical protein